MTAHSWIYLRADESVLTLGEHHEPDRWDGGLLHFTTSLEVAQMWARELRAGRPPVEVAGRSPRVDSG